MELRKGSKFIVSTQKCEIFLCTYLGKHGQQPFPIVLNVDEKMHLGQWIKVDYVMEVSYNWFVKNAIHEYKEKDTNIL